ncbi:MAG: LptF/LptG family permease [Planctomycetaceae bacterium]|nr:LptF/LptG family permease [Planctomycetaceae bacterium]
MTTYDRYLLKRFLYVCFVFSVAVLGLFIIIDGFTNLDDFQLRASGGAGQLILLMAERYLYQSAMILDLAGPTIIVLGAVCALALMLKQGEVHPVLAAGIPTYRWSIVLPLSGLVLNGLLAANQEYVLPAIAPYLQTHHGDSVHDEQAVQPQYDPQWWIFITGAATIPGEQCIKRAEFLLPPTLVGDYLKLQAEHAYFYKQAGDHPAGWLLSNVSPAFSELELTDKGREAIIPQKNGTDVFVTATLTFDQVCRQNSSVRLISTAELLRRLQQPSVSAISRRSQIVHLHARLTRPILNLLGILAAIPLIVRRERTSPMQQVANIGVCMATLAAIMGLSMGSQSLGQAGILAPEQAVWWPLIASGAYVGWLSGIVRT